MTQPLDLRSLEQYCETLYNPPNPSSRIQAENILNYHCPTFSAGFGTNSSVSAGSGSADAASSHSPNINSPIEFATSRLKTLVDDHFAAFTAAEQHGLRSFVLQYLYQNLELPPFILAAQAQLFSVITKLGWIENQEFRPLLDHIQVFFQQGVGHRILGIRILTAVTTEMNISGPRNVVKHRKSAVGFRDTQLLPIFQSALSMLQSVLQSQLADPDSEKLKEAILLLMKSCLSFDFIGTSYEESSDDIGSVQVPAGWRVVFEQPGYLDVLWECWKSFSSPVSVLHRAFIRGSVLYLLTFWNKTVSSLSSAKQETEHFIESITVNLSRAYLNSRLDCVHAVMDGEADDPLESEETLLLSLDMFANIVRTKYTVSGRIIVDKFKDLSLKYRDLIQRASALSGTTSPPIGASDVKESLMVIEMQLTWMVYIMSACIGARVMYQSTSEQDHMDGEFACEVLGFIHQLQVWTAQRSLYLASADAHLYIQSSIIYFYTQFRSSYIGEDSSKAVKVYTQLSERWGLNTPNQVLDVILSSSLGNLRSSGDLSWRKQEDQLVLRTLKLFMNLSAGYSSVKYIRKLDTTKALLKNHNSSEFRFLDPKRKSSDTDVGRCRTMYYTTLSRILFAEDNIDAEFWRFVKPWEVTLNQITLAFGGKGGLGEEDIRLILLGLFKDLRGFVTSISNRRQFNLFYEWFYPSYTPIALRAIEIWPQNELSIAILRFWNEFATNKSSRVTFDSSSPNGILLFRETSNILYTYGQSLLSRPITSESTRWSEKYKGIMLYFNIMSVSLSGKYANFGVFKLYGDKALDRVLEIFFQLMLAVPVDDMVSFPKLALSYFSVIDVFATDHMIGMPSMPHPVLGYIFRALGEAIPIYSPEANTSTMACSAIDKIVTFVLNWLIKNKVRKQGDLDIDEMLDASLEVDLSSSTSSTHNQHRGNVELTSGFSSNDLLAKQSQDQYETHWLVEYVLSNKDVLSYLFVVLFQVVVFENRSNYWSLSRPLLGLILLNRAFFAEYTENFVRAQLPDRQDQLRQAISMT
ncbi:Exportin 7 [Mortierella sp. AM989]|nr:Exportin 7 [Mortierella sp. AM989]